MPVFNARLGDVLKPLGLVLCIAIAYATCGRLALLLAIPPGYATAIFPPAGIALGLVFLRTRSAFAGIFLGSFALNTWVSYAPDAHLTHREIGIALLIAGASALQASVGGHTLQRLLRNRSSFDTARDVSTLFLATPCICLISATLSVTGLFIVGMVGSTNIPISWFTWWIGDIMGVLIMFPLVMAFAGKPRVLWRRRAPFIALPIIGALAFFIFIFTQVNRWERAESLSDFRAESRYVIDHVETYFHDQELLLEQLRGFMTNASDRKISREEFRRFADNSKRHFRYLIAIEWAPHVTHSERIAFEAEQRQTFPHYQILESANEYALQPTRERADYYPITYFVLFQTVGFDVLGFDFSSSAQTATALIATQRTEIPVATEPLKLTSTPGSTTGGLLLMLAIRNGATDGVIGTLSDVDQLITDTIADRQLTLHVRLTDERTQKRLLDTFNSTETDSAFEQQLHFGTRSYRLEFNPAAIYLQNHRGWQSWTVLTLGLFSTGLLGAFLMLSSGHKARVEEEVELHLRELKESTEKLRASEQRWQFALEGTGDGVWDLNFQTGELYLSQQEMAVLGYEGEPAQTSNIEIWKARANPQDTASRQDALKKYMAGETAVYTYEFRTLTRDQQWRWIRARGMLIARSATGEPLRMIGVHTNIDTEKHREFKLMLHSVVMEMLAREKKLPAVVETITTTLHHWNTDLCYVGLIASESHFYMIGNDHFAAELQAREFLFGTTLASAGVAIRAGEMVRVFSKADPFTLALNRFAGDAGLVVCWSELIRSSSGETLGALIAFATSKASDTLPDLDHMQQAANLMSEAIARKNFEEQLQLASSVFDASSEAILVVDANNCTLAVNPAFTLITGFMLADVQGCHPEMFIDGGNNAATTALMYAELANNGYWKGELWGRRKDGSGFPFIATINTIFDDAKRVVRRVCIFSDITDRKIAEEHLQHVAQHDTLTGLPNRMLFRDRLTQALASARRDNALLAVLYIDLDHFKPVNDNLGHAIGDRLLDIVAERMKRCVRQTDTVARIGGDEFVILLPRIMATDDSIDIAGKIREALELTFEIDAHKIHISASIGIAIYPHDGTTEEALSARADQAMYLAKQRGRNAIEFYRDGGVSRID